MRLEQPFKESIRQKRASCTWRSNWVRRIGSWRWATGCAGRAAIRWRRGHRGAARVHRQGQGALRAGAGGERAQLL